MVTSRHVPSSNAAQKELTSFFGFSQSGSKKAKGMIKILLCLDIEIFILSGSPANSGPLDFATRQSFPLFFVHEKGLVHMFKKCYNYFPILYFCVATS